MPHSKDTKRYPAECRQVLRRLDAEPEAVLRFPCPDSRSAKNLARRLGSFRDAAAKDADMPDVMRATAHAMRISIDGTDVIVMHRDNSPEAKILRKGLEG